MKVVVCLSTDLVCLLVCPETDVVFPCVACVCSFVHMHARTSVHFLLCVCVTVDSKLSHSKLVHLGHVDVAE